jgi:hypothetical protein
MSPATRRIASLVATGLVAIVLIACSGASTAPPPSGGPTAAPSQAPTPAPTDVPASTASPDGGTGAIPIPVDLQNVTGADVSVDVVDRSGTLLNARSGRPAEGASVEAGSIKVENIDPRTLRLTWTDFPIDNRLTLYIDAQGVGFRFLLIQPEPTGPTDAIGVDRILELTFDHDISSAQVESIVQGGLDTSD